MKKINCELITCKHNSLNQIWNQLGGLGKYGQCKCKEDLCLSHMDNDSIRSEDEELVEGLSCQNYVYCDYVHRKNVRVEEFECKF